MSIKSNAEIIRDETTAGANTATRVGGNLVEIANDLITKQTEVNLNTAKVGISTLAQTIQGVKTFTSDLFNNGNIESTSIFLSLKDTTGTIFRGIRSTGWLDNVNTRFFQVGEGNDRVFFTAQNGGGFSRLGFAATAFQIISQSYTQTPAPIGIFEVITNTGRAFVIMQTGNMLVNTLVDNGVDKLKVNGSALVTTLKTSAFTVATLPAPPLQGLGARAHVTDALNPTYLGTLTGGGTVKCPVFYNGTAWVSA